MIINLPSSKDFDNLANSCLTQAFNIVFETDKHVYDNFDKDLQDDVWTYSQEKLNTAVVLLHQGIEAFMKASVSLVTPLLLIEGKRSDWPVLPKQRDKEFNDFYTTPSEALLYTFYATTKKDVDEALISHIEEIRKVRNQIVHGISRTRLNPKFLVDKILDTYLFFKGKDAWWEAVSGFHFNHPLTGYYDLSIETAQFAERLDYALNMVGKSKMAKHFAINLRGRSYFCPKCLQDYVRGVGEDYKYAWAFLTPNSASSTSVTCLNCGNENKVIRQPCPYDGCKGNVLYRIEDLSKFNDASVALTDEAPEAMEDEHGFCLTCQENIWWKVQEI
ncbi:hypothetical protein Q3A66_16885 [Hymenobacter sp. BT770]|uniref:hypothetical protein n=1 Tax=Hymenobacter sp. BT770 TaxID=2886942 RepID=UPI001D10D815|nr:hypothetical protein [Hymenobacter sp. BT770]MCC3154693.1 hypothetical protein [Hymenobacter sp. BT770]MDO3416747.1 hypothetical protein [Hymenobacter sp. BT770]